mgnify:CR=1 FL=1
MIDSTIVIVKHVCYQWLWLVLTIESGLAQGRDV